MDEKQKGKQLGQWLAAGLVILFALYCLSLPGAVWLMTYGYLPTGSFRMYTRPYFILAFWCPQAIENRMIWYLNIWL